MTINTAINLSIIIPALNEAKFIGQTLEQIERWLNQNEIQDDTEVIVVAADGGDDTAQIAERYASRFLNFIVIRPGEKVGKGRDVKIGMLAARGGYRVFTDADLATPLHHIKSVLAAFDEGYQVVVGVRDINKMHDTFMRRLSSIFSNWLIRRMLGLSIMDTQCGFKGFTADAASKLFEGLVTQGWGFDFEILSKCKENKISVKEVEIYDWEDPKGADGLAGESQLKAMFSTLKELRTVSKLNR